MKIYTTIGSVRGCCGHKHRTIEAAERCLAKDQEGCTAQGGYSDRQIVESHDNGYMYTMGDSTDIFPSLYYQYGTSRALKVEDIGTRC